jgi:SAM-dependent methyltransferase
MAMLATRLAKRLLPFETRYWFRRLDWRRRYLQGFLESGQGPGHGPVECPIAGREFHHFVPRKRGGLMTPSNGALARHRLIWLYLERETALFSGGKRLLHVAPERCLFERFSRTPGLSYLPGDKMADGYGRQSGIQRIDLLQLAFDEGSFDYLLCNHVLEHLPDDHRAMRECFRVLVPGGTAIFTVPLRDGPTLEDPSVTSPADRKRLFGQWDHVRYYGPDIADRLAEVGFRVTLVPYADQFTDAERRRYGLTDTKIIRADKPA